MYISKGNQMHFFDEQHEPFDPVEILYVGAQFAIARVDMGGQDVVALFSEDDENYFWKCSFSSHWLPDLEKVARTANVVAKANPRK
jgi:hypothetical protein